MTRPTVEQLRELTLENHGETAADSIAIAWALRVAAKVLEREAMLMSFFADPRGSIELQAFSDALAAGDGEAPPVERTITTAQIREGWKRFHADNLAPLGAPTPLMEKFWCEKCGGTLLVNEPPAPPVADVRLSRQTVEALYAVATYLRDDAEPLGCRLLDKFRERLAADFARSQP